MPPHLDPLRSRVRRNTKIIFSGAVCLFVLGFYGWTARSNVRQMYGITNPAEAYYNLLVDGFRSGHLYLKKEVPPGLAKLPDPYDRVANMRYQEGNRLHDVSYYMGRLYLYFGITPALVLFWPYVALTGHYLFHKAATAIFCAIGFLASVLLLRALRRRYFPEVGEAVLATCAMALGLATCVPVMLQRPDVYEVAISCAYAMVMLAFAGIWQALHDPARRGWWLAAASLAYGLAVGARPTILFGALILLVPVIYVWISAPERNEQRWLVTGRMLVAAVGPISLIGFGLMLYNYLRFHSPFEFGTRYALSGEREDDMQHLFGLKYFWFNFRVYFLEPIRWARSFPFGESIEVPPAPAGQLGVESPFGLLPNIPIVWSALAVPLAWRERTAGGRPVLRLFIAALAAFFGISALTICLFAAACARYQVDFVPVLVLLAVCGILGLERTVSAKPRWRHAVRCGWISALFFSVMVNLLLSVGRYAEEQCRVGMGQLHLGRPKEAITYFQEALRLNPNDATTHYYFAIDLVQTGRLPEAINHLEQVLRLDPDFPGARAGLLQVEQRLQQHTALPSN